MIYQTLLPLLLLSQWNKNDVGDVPRRITPISVAHNCFEMVNPRITSAFNRHETNREQSCSMQEMPSYISRWRRQETAQQGRPEASASVSMFARRWSLFDGTIIRFKCDRPSDPKRSYGPSTATDYHTGRAGILGGLVVLLRVARSSLCVLLFPLSQVCMCVCVCIERPTGHDLVHVSEIKWERFKQTSGVRRERGMGKLNCLKFASWTLQYIPRTFHQLYTWDFLLP